MRKADCMNYCQKMLGVLWKGVVPLERQIAYQKKEHALFFKTCSNYSVIVKKSLLAFTS